MLYSYCMSVLYSYRMSVLYSYRMSVLYSYRMSVHRDSKHQLIATKASHIISGLPD